MFSTLKAVVRNVSASVTSKVMEIRSWPMHGELVAAFVPEQDKDAFAFHTELPGPTAIADAGAPARTTVKIEKTTPRNPRNIGSQTLVIAQKMASPAVIVTIRGSRLAKTPISLARSAFFRIIKKGLGEPDRLPVNQRAQSLNLPS
jgi:hypothetical protein